MATKYQVGECVNEVNGFKVELSRYTKACQDGSSRAARFWGTITSPDGEVFTIPSQGFTVEQIDHKVGVKATPRGTLLRKLQKMREAMIKNGLSNTEEIDVKIAEVKKIEEEKAEELRKKKAASSAEVREIKKQLKAIKKMRDDAVTYGFDTIQYDLKIDELNKQLEKSLETNKEESSELGVEI